jgi:hypothetical protein
MAYSIFGMIKRDNELWFYVEYTNDKSINGSDRDKRYARLRMPIDRFAYLSASNAGTVQTKKFKFTGSHLTLNLDAAGGSVRAALLDENSKPIPGFALADADPVKSNDVEKIVTWKGHSDLKALVGRTVKLQLQIEKAKVFALQFAP